jgi:hypothetical protein
MTKPPKLSPNEQIFLNGHFIIEACEGRTETVRNLLVAGADVHAEDDWALRMAAERDHTKTVQVLLASGADVHAVNDWALRYAACYGYAQTVKVLLAGGADVHAQDDEALRCAAIRRQAGNLQQRRRTRHPAYRHRTKTLDVRGIGHRRPTSRHQLYDHRDAKLNGLEPEAYLRDISGGSGIIPSIGSQNSCRGTGSICPSSPDSRRQQRQPHPEYLLRDRAGVFELACSQILLDWKRTSGKCLT